MKRLLSLIIVIVLSTTVLASCGKSLTKEQQDAKAMQGVWIETLEGSGNLEMRDDGSIRIFDALQTMNMTGTWEIPEVGRLDISLEGNPAVNLGYKFEDDTLSIWPEGKQEEQALTYKRATQDDINEMQKKAQEYADKVKENNEKSSSEDPEPIDEGTLSMKQEEAKKDKVIVVFETTMGNMELAIYPKVAPLTAENFLNSVKDGFYDGIIFHRVIPQFMIQGGMATEENVPKETSVTNFKDEINPEILGVSNTIIQENERQGYQYDYTLPSLPIKYGALAMANAGANTNTTQFFIVTKYDGCKWLDGKHTVFGECIDGMDVALKIQNVPRDSYDQPNDNVVITKAYIKE